MTRFTTTGGCNLLFLLLMVACASAPQKKELLQTFTGSHPACSLESMDVNSSFKDYFIQAFPASGSMAVTTLGFVSDAAFLSLGAITVSMFCQYGPSSCVEDFFSNYFEILEKNKVLWLGKNTFHKTVKWRCMPADKVSKALRKSALCNFERGHFIHTYELITFLEGNRIINDCTSDLERLEIVKLVEYFKTGTKP